MSKVSANERALAKLLLSQRRIDMGIGEAGDIAAFLARRGVLAVSADTVTWEDCQRIATYYAEHLRPELRRLARGAK